MTAIDNSGFLNVCYYCGNPAFVPAATFSYNTSTKVLTVTDASAFGAGDGLKAINISVTDRKGNVKYGRITIAAAAATINLSSGFVPQYGFNIQATIVSNTRAIGDLAVYEVANPVGAIAGNLGYPNIELEGDGSTNVEP